jgi:uncharacterized cupredoxin-like copper-binding protein
VKLLGVVLATGLAFTGCAAGSSERTVELTVHHSRFSVDELQVRPGETVRFVLRNTDPIPHELIVGDQWVQDVHEKGTEAHHAERPGEVSVAPGATAVTTYRFGRAGSQLLFGCHLPGHWAYGMKGTIRVG